MDKGFSSSKSKCGHELSFWKMIDVVPTAQASTYEVGDTGTIAEVSRTEKSTEDLGHCLAEGASVPGETWGVTSMILSLDKGDSDCESKKVSEVNKWGMEPLPAG